MLSLNLLEKIIFDLLKHLKKNHDVLFIGNKECTQDSEYWIKYDYNFILEYLNSYLAFNEKLLKNIEVKPKGKIFIILSYNEPFIMSIIPILNALAVGNDITVKPSGKAFNFFSNIWKESGIIEKYNLKLEIIKINSNKEIEEKIKEVNAVYFFGGYQVAKSIAKICGDNFVEFYPHIEAADIKVWDIEDLDKIKNDDLDLLLDESFSHAGQICHRIQGVFVCKSKFSNFKKLLKVRFDEFCNSSKILNYIDNKFIINKEYFEKTKEEIKNSEYEEVISAKNVPIIVINPKIDSDLVKNAYFLPILWIYPYRSKEELVEILRARKFYLGLNIKSSNTEFVKKIIDNTNFTRYTLNLKHTKIYNDEGWGGAWPSGFSGYKKWIYHFSNPYVILK